MEKTYPILYKKTSTGKIQMWSIQVSEQPNGMAKILTKFGQVDGKIQEAVDVISEGKNIGKANATTPWTQALNEAQGYWEGKKKKGYVEDSSAASAGETGLPAKGPMLANEWQDRKHKMSYPAMVQAKLDGLRCLAVVKDGKCSLYSRTLKPWLTVPHIVEQVEALMKIGGIKDIVLDGELYVESIHKLKVSDDTYKGLPLKFNDLQSIVKRGEVHENHGHIQYFIYDCMDSEKTFHERDAYLAKVFSKSGDPSVYKKLIKVPSKEVADEAQINSALDELLSEGYEGLMVRGKESMYETKRTDSLLKYKRMIDEETPYKDAEFLIIDVVPGDRGKMRDKGIFVCQTKVGVEFTCKMEGPLEDLKKYLDNKDQYIGKYLTVRYQEETESGSLRFQVGVRIREEE